MFRRAAEAREQRLGPLDPATITALGHLADVLRDDGQLQAAQDLYFQVIDRHRQTIGLCEIGCSSPLQGLIAVLRRQGDYLAMRDLLEGWIREVLAIPREVDPYLRNRQAVRLDWCAPELTTLPRGVPFDTGLATRAAETAITLHEGWFAWSIL